jgi:hypothetical protein
VIQIRNLPVSFGDSISFLSMVQGYALDRRLGTAELRSAGQVGYPSTSLRTGSGPYVSRRKKKAVILLRPFTTAELRSA